MSSAIAETQQSLSIESFSYNWVVNLNPSLENQEDDFLSFSSRSFSLDEEANSFIEMDPKLPPSKRFFIVPHQHDLSAFHLPTFESSPSEEVHADELIYNGYLMPLSLFVKSSERNYTSPISSSCLNEKKEVPYLRKVGATSLRRCRRLSKNILLKYLNFLRPLFRKIRILQNKNVSLNKCSSGMESPNKKRVVGRSVEDNRRSCDSESSIYEAVLHCKRTIDPGN